MSREISVNISRVTDLLTLIPSQRGLSNSSTLYKVKDIKKQAKIFLHITIFLFVILATSSQELYNRLYILLPMETPAGI